MKKAMAMAMVVMKVMMQGNGILPALNPFPGMARAA